VGYIAFVTGVIVLLLLALAIAVVWYDQVHPTPEPTPPSRGYSCLAGRHCWIPNGGSDNGWYCEKCMHCGTGRAVCVTSCPEAGLCEAYAVRGEHV
jgi:hypothetical protein